MKKYIVFALLPNEPFIVYYCGTGDKGQPLFHEAPGLIKQMSLKEAKKVFESIGSKNKEVKFCLMEWLKFVEVYQFTGYSKEKFIENSIKTK